MPANLKCRWSRQPSHHPYNDNPVHIMKASNGATARMQRQEDGPPTYHATLTDPQGNPIHSMYIHCRLPDAKDAVAERITQLTADHDPTGFL